MLSHIGIIREDKYLLKLLFLQRHDIPISAIPCLAYRKALEEEAKQKEIDKKIEEQIKNGTWVNNIKNNEKAKKNTEKEVSNNENNDSPVNAKRKENAKCPFSHKHKAALKDDESLGGNQSKNVDETHNCDSEIQEVPADAEMNGDEEKEGVKEATENEEEIPLNRQPVVLPGGIVMPPPRVETVNTSWKTQHLSHELVNDYCKKLFKFKTVNIMHFK